MDVLHKKYKLSPSVKIRRESFGGILYDHKSGRVLFIYQELFFDLLTKKDEITFAAYLQQDDSQRAKISKLIKQLEAGGIIIA